MKPLLLLHRESTEKMFISRKFERAMLVLLASIPAALGARGCTGRKPNMYVSQGPRM